MDFLEQVAAAKRKMDPESYDESEARIEAEDGGFVVSCFSDDGREIPLLEGNAKEIRLLG